MYNEILKYNSLELSKEFNINHNRLLEKIKYYVKLKNYVINENYYIDSYRTKYNNIKKPLYYIDDNIYNILKFLLVKEKYLDMDCNSFTNEDLNHYKYNSYDVRNDFI